MSRSLPLHHWGAQPDLEHALEGRCVYGIQRALPPPALLARERRLAPPLQQLPHRRRIFVGSHLFHGLGDQRRCFRRGGRSALLRRCGAADAELV